MNDRNKNSLYTGDIFTFQVFIETFVALVTLTFDNTLLVLLCLSDHSFILIIKLIIHTHLCLMMNTYTKSKKM